MSYNLPYEGFAEIKAIWRIHTPSKRYKNKILAIFEKLMQPAKTSFYKISFPKYDGYQFDLMSLTIEHEDATMPSTMPSYPDW